MFTYKKKNSYGMQAMFTYTKKQNTSEFSSLMNTLVSYSTQCQKNNLAYTSEDIMKVKNRDILGHQFQKSINSCVVIFRPRSCFMCVVSVPK